MYIYVLRRIEKREIGAINFNSFILNQTMIISSLCISNAQPQHLAFFVFYIVAAVSLNKHGAQPAFTY